MNLGCCLEARIIDRPERVSEKCAATGPLVLQKKFKVRNVFFTRAYKILIWASFTVSENADSRTRA